MGRGERGGVSAKAMRSGVGGRLSASVGCELQNRVLLRENHIHC